MNNSTKKFWLPIGMLSVLSHYFYTDLTKVVFFFATIKIIKSNSKMRNKFECLSE